LRNKPATVNASCQVWFNLAKEFQRRRFFLSLANQKQELLSAAIFVGQTERNKETLWRTLHRCCMPSLAPFGQAVSEEKTFLTVANQKQELPLAAIFVGGTGRNEETL
jgi:hypothetical protein